MTHSGRLVLPSNSEAPTLEDIALALSRAPRFGGHTIRPWTVIQHLLVCYHILLRYFADQGTVVNTDVPESQTRMRLYVLLHDAHEAVLCDVPSTWKSNIHQQQSDDLDHRIYRSLSIPRPSWGALDIIHHVDFRAFLAEASHIGPVALQERLSEMYGIPKPEDVSTVQYIEEMFPAEHAREFWLELVTARLGEARS